MHHPILMHEMKPRIAPLKRSDAHPSVEALYQLMDQMGNPPPNMHLTFGKHPPLYEKWLPFATYIIPASSLSPRERQLLILRSAYVWRSGYIWAQHEFISRRLEALTQQEIDSVVTGDHRWSELERALIASCDDCRQEGQITHTNWGVLANHFDEQQLLDVVFTIGQYALIAICLKSLMVPLDSGLSLPEWS